MCIASVSDAVGSCTENAHCEGYGLRTFVPKSSHAQSFFKLATQKGNVKLLSKR